MGQMAEFISVCCHLKNYSKKRTSEIIRREKIKIFIYVLCICSTVSVEIILTSTLLTVNSIKLMTNTTKKFHNGAEH